MKRLELGPVGVPTVVFSGSWLAATALVAPGLYERMTRVLGDDVVAAVLHRDLMFAFAPPGIAGLAEIVAAEYRTAAKLFTTSMFTLTAGSGPAPLL